MKPNLNHPITDLDATFSGISPEYTHRVMETLRKAGIEFDVSINNPKDEPSEEDYDIFWFRPQDDQKRIGDIIRAAINGA